MLVGVTVFVSVPGWAVNLLLVLIGVVLVIAVAACAIEVWARYRRGNVPTDAYVPLSRTNRDWLRQYLPRKRDLAEFGQPALDQIAAELNGRPRKTLGWATPAERMEALLR